MYISGVGDTRGYYQDGAYTAAPNEEEWSGEDSVETNDNSGRLRRIYYSSLLDRFTALRERLRQDPPAAVVASLPQNQTPIVRKCGRDSNTYKEWRSLLSSTDPWPAQVAAMDKVAALRLLRVILNNKFLKLGYKIADRTSRWLWALLARMPDSGELDHFEVGVIRDLGKQAVLMMVSMAEMAALREQAELNEGAEDDNGVEELGEEDDEGESQVDDEGGGSTAAEDGQVTADAGDDDIEEGEVPDKPGPQDSEAELAAAKARLLASVANAETAETGVKREAKKWPGMGPEEEARAAMNQRATLSMILTVAGELYGQRDLLEFRDPFGD